MVVIDDDDDVMVKLIDVASLGVIGPADCGPGVKPGWLIDFCRTSRIFNCKLCLFGNISRCFICKCVCVCVCGLFFKFIYRMWLHIVIGTNLKFICIFWAGKHAATVEQFHDQLTALLQCFAVTLFGRNVWIAIGTCAGWWIAATDTAAGTNAAARL